MHPNIHSSTIYNSQDMDQMSWVQDNGLNQDNSPSVHWQKKKWYIYTMKYYSAIKKNEIMSFEATQVDLEMIILSEVSQTKINIIWYHSQVESKNMV